MSIDDRDVKAAIAEVGVDTWELWVLQYMQDPARGGAKIDSIDAETRRIIQAIITSEVGAGEIEGLGVQEIGRNIQRQLILGNYPTSAAMRGQRIARTEVIGAQNKASFNTASTVGDSLVKVWSTRLDSRTRASHAAINGKVLEMSENFQLSNGSGSGPHADTLPASEVVNCRCILLYQRKDEFEG